jgi:hypothetical protein
MGRCPEAAHVIRAGATIHRGTDDTAQASGGPIDSRPDIDATASHNVTVSHNAPAANDGRRLR